MARCEGIGGAGEPPSFILPAWINTSDMGIVIDFSAPPKGGPKDFAGTWDNDGIRFTRDGNKWPKVPAQRSDYIAAFMRHFEFEDEASQVSKEDFFEYNRDVYQSVPNEEAMITYLKETWGVTENEQSEDFVQ